MPSAMFKVIDDLGADVLSQSTLLLPAVSTGNVGQLAIDLLIHNFADCKHLGLINAHRFVLPIVGSCPFDENSDRLCTPFEAFRVSSRKLIIVQQRSDFIRHTRKEFLRVLIEWLKAKQFKQVLVLSGAFAFARIDEELTGSQIRYILNSKSSVFEDGLVQCCLPKLQKKGEPFIAAEAAANLPDGKDFFIPGCGITKALYTRCEAESIPLCALIQYCMEGDNTDDALQLALKVLELFGITQAAKIKLPPSWQLMFGTSTTVDE